MRRRALFIALGVGLAAGGAALAQGQSNQDAYQLPEPSVSSAQVLRLPRDSSCVHITRATVRFLPPPGAVFGVLRVTAHGREVVRLTGVPRAASATIRLTGSRTTVRVSGTHAGRPGGQRDARLPPLRARRVEAEAEAHHADADPGRRRRRRLELGEALQQRDGAAEHVSLVAGELGVDRLGEPADAPAAVVGQRPAPARLSRAGRLSAHNHAIVTGRSFFPQLIDAPFRAGLHAAFTFAIVACLVAAVASLLRGGKYEHQEAHDAHPVARPIRV